jgi:inosine-uridine nucleoside N-ribohydrolase
VTHLPHPPSRCRRHGRIDDCLALLLAFASPEIDVRGVSVIYGNTVLEHAHRNALEIARRAGRRVPVGVSARRPLRRPLDVALRRTASRAGIRAVPPAGTVLDFAKPLDAARRAAGAVR